MQTSSRVELSGTPQLSHSAEISDETRNIIGRDAVIENDLLQALVEH